MTPRLSALLLALAAPTAPAQRAGAVESAPIEIVADLDLQRLGDEALAIATSAWNEACALYGVDPGPAGQPAKVHLYARVGGYEAACDRLVGGEFKRNLAFSEWRSLTAHVVLQPPLENEALQRFAPTWQTLRLVAHETAHLARYSACPGNRRSHPGWYADGAACWVETKALAAQGLLNRPEQSPHYATNELRVQRMLKLDRLPSVEDLIHDRTDSLEFYDRYAARWLLFRFLAEGPHAKAFRRFHDDLRRLGESEDFGERAAAALGQRLGVPDWNKVDGAFRKWVAALEPEWDQVIGSLETAGEEWTQAAFEANSMAFVNSAAGRKAYAIEGALVAYADRAASPQMNVLLGRELRSNDANRFVSVAFVPGVGVNVLEYDGDRPPPDDWRNLAFAAAAETAVGRPIAFRVECRREAGTTSIVVRIEGKLVAQAAVGRELDGPWGLGVQGGCSGTWRAVRRVPLVTR
jgi:hypothetical protein